MTAINPTEAIIANWRDAAALRQLVGQPGRNEEIKWGEIPTNKAIVDALHGFITRIRTYDGLNCSLRGRYGSPVADTTVLPEFFRNEVEQHLPELAQWIGDPRAETAWESGYCALHPPAGKRASYNPSRLLPWTYSRFTSGCGGSSLPAAIAEDARVGQENR